MQISIERGAGALASFSRGQVDRLSYIDFRLYFMGELRRADVIERFGVGPAAATRDIGLYRDLAAENLVFDGTTKCYRLGADFQPIAVHSPLRVLSALSQGFGQGGWDAASPLLRSEAPSALGTPDAAILAPVTRAIHQRRVLRLTYHSLSSGAIDREIVPFALVDTGTRWHARAFDRRSSEFRDFVFTRMKAPRVLDDEAERAEGPDNDEQWSRIVELELVPHPNHPAPEVVRLDYKMQNGLLKVKLRAANVGYILQRWSVDCSPDHSLRGKEYALWLRDPLALYGAENAVLAPGYRRPKAKSSAARV